MDWTIGLTFLKLESKVNAHKCAFSCGKGSIGEKSLFSPLVRYSLDDSVCF